MAKFCSNCGAEVQDGFAFCEKCGTPVEAQIQGPAPAQASAPQYNQQYAQTGKPARNGMALAGFILSLCNLVCCDCLSLFGLIFSILGMVKAKDYNGDRKGLAIAGLIITIVGSIIWLVIYVIAIANADYSTTTTTWGY